MQPRQETTIVLNHDYVFVIHSLNPKYSFSACELIHLVGILNFNTITVDATLIKTLDRRQHVLNRDSVLILSFTVLTQGTELEHVSWSIWLEL